MTNGALEIGGSRKGVAGKLKRSSGKEGNRKEWKFRAGGGGAPLPPPPSANLFPPSSIVSSRQLFLRTSLPRLLLAMLPNEGYYTAAATTTTTASAASSSIFSSASSFSEVATISSYAPLRRPTTQRKEGRRKRNFTHTRLPLFPSFSSRVQHHHYAAAYAQGREETRVRSDAFFSLRNVKKIVAVAAASCSG